MKLSSGYVVVRLPQFVGQIFGDVPKTLSVACREISYGGLDRDPWIDMETAFYEGRLSDELNSVRMKIMKARLASFSPGVCRDFELARAVLNSCNREQNEIIEIGDLCESMNSDGIDCYADGYGSLIRLGIFTIPDAFDDFISSINNSGMFDDVEAMSAYVAAYVERCNAFNLEPISAQQEKSYFSVCRHGSEHRFTAML